MRVYIIYYYDDFGGIWMASWAIGEVYTTKKAAEKAKQDYIKRGYKDTFIIERVVRE